MARTPEGYWEKRSTDLMLRLEQGTEKTIDNLVKVYNQATKNINKEINEIFRNYASESGLSREVLTKMLNKRETDTYYRNLLNTIEKIKNENVRKKLLAKYNAPAYSYRINRFQALQNNIDVEIAKIADIEQTITKERYVDTIKEGYYHNIYDIQKGLGYGFNFSKIDTKTINLMLNEKWAENGNFSSRIWKNTDRLSNYLKINFTADTMSGKSISAMSKELSDTLNIGLYKSTRLIRTEVNHFANESEMLSYEELGIEKYRFVATLDNVTCKHCATLDNKVFNVKDRQAGKNYPPLHPNDRCTTVAVFDDEVTEGLQRRARDGYGNTVFIPQNMNYNEWYDEYVTNSNNSGIINNRRIINSFKSIKLKPKSNVPNNINDFYNYILKQKNREDFVTTASDENGYITGQRLNSILGYDKLPTKVSIKEFKEMSEKSNTGTLYRGINAKTSEKCQEYINEFTNGKFYSGGQAGHIYGKGTYTGFGELGKNTAYNYANQEEHGKVIEMLLDKDAKIINYYDLFKETNKEVDEFIKENYKKYNIENYMQLMTNLNKIEKEDEFMTKYIFNVAHEYGYSAAIKGYDAIIADNELAKQKYVVILNRGKVIVHE